ncbi:cbb3-type cytochrome c oxidase subunit 3 [Shewanella inventionis]|nr:cbb3-type cytochrome c oxidase subunit 3 [Shewanella inventionis]MCL1158414.1 cbb3-type cytochrome c oxidase subunit 3 [Shewanella inventionis]UAL45378.1 cbb3-type cytochrome c oxidase subunit 3 [Shewanella inventionis]
MDYGTFQGILTIIVMVTFVGIFYWAYSKHSKSKFDEAANLVFSEEELAKMSKDSGDQK